MAAPRVALLFGNTAEHNSRAGRMARSLVEAGCDVTLVARAAPGLSQDETRHGYRIVRVPAPRGPRWLPAPGLPGKAHAPGLRSAVREGPGRLAQGLRFLLLARQWADAVERAVPGADAWQADGLVMLPVALKLAARRGGRVIYDSLEIYTESGSFARLPGLWRRLLASRERRWAGAADTVLTVNEACAAELSSRLGLPVEVVMNCAPRPAAFPPRPRRFHESLGLAAGTPVVLYHGYVFRNRGIEGLFEAIGSVPGAVLVVMGFGPPFEEYRSRAAALPHASRVHVIPGVPPDELLSWVASADVVAVTIEGSTLNHRLATPNKLFEAMSAGVPVVASDLPAMAPVIRNTGAGVLCDPADPADVARAIRSILEVPAPEREAYRERALSAARSEYNWERQAGTYLGVYRRLGVILGTGEA